MSDFQPDHSRLASRGRKRKQNRLLNLLIAIVCVLIIIVGFSIFFGGGGSQSASQGHHTQGQNNGGGNSGGAAAGSHQNKKKGNKSSNSQFSLNNGNTSKQSSPSSSNQKSKNKNQNKKKQKTVGPHNLVVPQGPWQPVGTQQTGTHQTSYSQGSQDWKEQMQALYEATGLSSSDSTLWWLGRDGASNKSVGYLTPKNDPHAFYVVHIEWINQKGWKPVSVQRKYIQDPQAWYKQKSG